jgi:hypothetical protein
MFGNQDSMYPSQFEGVGGQWSNATGCKNLLDGGSRTNQQQQMTTTVSQTICHSTEIFIAFGRCSPERLLHNRRFVAAFVRLFIA